MNNWGEGDYKAGGVRKSRVEERRQEEGGKGSKTRKEEGKNKREVDKEGRRGLGGEMTVEEKGERECGNGLNKPTR